MRRRGSRRRPLLQAAAIVLTAAAAAVAVVRASRRHPLGDATMGGLPAQGAGSSVAEGVAASWLSTTMTGANGRPATAMADSGRPVQR